MPMTLRSRKSRHQPRRATEAELPDARPAAARRSTRLSETETYKCEETDEPDSESVQNQVMETQQITPGVLEEETSEEADVTEMRSCSVVLDRLCVDDKSIKGENEEKEDIIRKGGKPASRIPTYYRRPEVNVPKKDTSAHESEIYEKAGSPSADALKSKLPDVKVLSLPLARLPKAGIEAPSALISTEQAGAAAHSCPIATPMSHSLPESGQYPLMTVSTRPSLRTGQGSNSPEQDKRETFEGETIPDAPTAHHHCEDSISRRPLEDMEDGCNVTFNITDSGDAEKSAENSPIAESSPAEAIMDEEPPWETEQDNIFKIKDSWSSSEREYEDDLIGEESEGQNSEEVEEHHQPLVRKSELSDSAEESAGIDESNSNAAPEQTAKASLKKSTERGSFFSLILFCFLPTTLLLLGGFGQHVWHYGLPMSVAHLTAQLELHMLEGFGFSPEPCSTDCRVHLVESIPVGLYPSSPSSRGSIADSWLHLLDKAKSSVHIAAFYFTLQGNDSSDYQGRMVFDQLKQVESKGAKLQIAVNAPQMSTQDTTELAATGAEVKEVYLGALTGGIVHTKLWVVDKQHMYLGSANMDWRSLSQVKEIGLSVEDCSCLAQDAFRIFGVYWSLNGSLPVYWPARLSALSSSLNPLHLKFNGVPAQVYLSSAPPQISARGRTDDLAAILSVIDDAQKFIYISVMDYLPMSEFTKPIRFWPAIDSALRAAACARGVQVRLMVSCWGNSPGHMFPFLQSLQVLNSPRLKCDIHVKIFTVPSTAEQKKIPFARVNHAKYMVTDRVVYIGTSNWSENYFTQTAGVGLVVNQTGSDVKKGQETLQMQTEELFLRDWTSEYVSTLSVDDANVCSYGHH